jgi:hypothetical protein
MLRCRLSALSQPEKPLEAFRNSHISDDDVAFVGERGDQVRVVSLATDDMGTKIILLRSAKSPSQVPTEPPAESPSQSPTP